MIHDLIFNGKALSTFGFTLKEKPFYMIAERNSELQDMAGGDGAVILDTGGFKNVEVPYPVNSIPFWNQRRSDMEIERDLAAWLFAKSGYKILRDTYNPGYFTHAVCVSPEKISVLAKRAHDTVLTFSRKAYWYSDLGQQPITIPVNSAAFAKELDSPEDFDTKPIIKVSASAPFSMTVNGKTMSVDFGDTVQRTVVFNSLEDTVTVSGNDVSDYVSGDYMPMFTAETNNISLQSTDEETKIAQVEIIPNWRRL